MKQRTLHLLIAVMMFLFGMSIGAMLMASLMIGAAANYVVSFMEREGYAVPSAAFIYDFYTHRNFIKQELNLTK